LPSALKTGKTKGNLLTPMDMPEKIDMEYMEARDYDDGLDENWMDV